MRWRSTAGSSRTWRSISTGRKNVDLIFGDALTVDLGDLDPAADQARRQPPVPGRDPDRRRESRRPADRRALVCDGAARSRRPLLRATVDEGVRRGVGPRPAGGGANRLPPRLAGRVPAAAQCRLGARRLPAAAAPGGLSAREGGRRRRVRPPAQDARQLARAGRPGEAADDVFVALEKIDRPLNVRAEELAPPEFVVSCRRAALEALHDFDAIRPSPPTPASLVVPLVHIGVCHGEIGDRPVEDVALAKVRRDRDPVTRPRVCSRERPAADLRVQEKAPLRGRLPCLPMSSSPRAGARSSREPFRRGRSCERIHPSRMSLDACIRRWPSTTRLPAFRYLLFTRCGFEHRWLRLLDLEEEGIAIVAANQKDDPGPRSDASDPDHLPRHVDDPVALEQLASVALER